MSNDSPPREYKYKLKADDFVKLFLATNEEFEELKKQLLGNTENGIGRKNGYTGLIDVEIEGDIIIKDVFSNNCSPIICIDVKMKAFSIRHSNLKSGNGLKETYLEFNDSEIESITITANSAIGDVFLTRCEIGLIEIYSSSIEWCFITESKTGNIRISSTSKTKDFHILKSITSNFGIDDSITGTFDFNETSILDFDLTNSQSKNITFDSCGTGKINIQKSKLESISLNTCSISDISFDRSVIQQFIANLLYCNFSILNSTISYFKVYNCFIPEFIVEQLCKIEAYISGGQINNLNFYDTTLSRESLFSFSKTRIYFLQMEEFSMLGSLYYRYITKAEKEFDWIDIEAFIKVMEIEGKQCLDIIEQIKSQYSSSVADYTKKCVKLKNKVKQSCVRISRSSLGKTEFIDCSFSEFHFEYNNSKIVDCSFIGEPFPINNVQIRNSKPDKLETHRQMASLCNQLKKIFEAQGDIYHASQFQSKWAEHQLKALKLQRSDELKDAEKPKLWSSFKIYFNTTSGDIYTLWFNKLSNLHGESWPRALGLIVGSGICFYMLYLLSLGKLFNGNDFDPNLMGYYFEYLNPVHKINFIDENAKINGWTIAIDFVSRIVVTYGIYQFIAAFRKHSKKQ